MSTSAQKDLRVLLAGLEAQGCVLQPRSDGTAVYLPSGALLQILHHSPSDSRGWRLIRSRVKRAGLAWPLDDRAEMKRIRKSRRKEEC